MANLNPSGSASRMLAAGTNSIGYCLVSVGDAILNGSRVLQGAGTAAEAYADAGAAHQHATHAPADYPTFFSGAKGSGDVVIAVGDGVNCIASDYTDAKGTTHWGHTGRMTLAARARQVSGTLLGWTDNFLGYTLTGTDPSGGGGTPVTQSHGEDDMAVKIWHYADGTANGRYILIDHLNMTYRLIVSGSLEDQGLHNDVNAGFARVDEIGDPAWGQNFGNGQFLNISAPYVPAAGSGATAAQVQAIADAQTTLINTSFTNLWTAISNAFTSVLTAIKAIPAGATEAQTQAIVTQSTSDIIAKIPTKLSV